MKKLYFLFFTFIIFQTFGQPPQKMSYQAVVRDVNNQLVVNQQVGVRISIIKHALGGVPIYEETHQVRTNGNGLFTLQVGNGLPAPGTNFSTIPWGDDDYFIKSEIDISGGNSYTITGTEQLISVPYALYAGGGNYLNLDNRPPDGNNFGDIMYWNSNTSSWNILPIGQQGQVLSVHNGGLIWISTSGVSNTPPTIRTDTIFDITGRTAYVKSTIIDAGSTGIIASGVCWSTNPYPSIGNNHTTDGTSIGSFVSRINGLTSGTTFYARAYATNSVGTSYGDPIAFTTPTHCGTVTDYDNNEYNTIYIGAQCWMKENLKTTHYSNGAEIPAGFSSDCGKYYFKYNHSNANMDIYGLLYTWSAVMNGAGSSSNNPSGIQGVCPSGWHVPSNSEWCELENYIEPGIDVTCSSTGFRGSMSKKLTAPQLWTTYANNSFSPGYWSINPSGFNISDFSALPGGSYYCGSNYFRELNNYAYFWTSTSNANGYAYYRYMYYQESGVGMNTLTSPNNYAYSVRCVKN